MPANFSDCGQRAILWIGKRVGTRIIAVKSAHLSEANRMPVGRIGIVRLVSERAFHLAKNQYLASGKVGPVTEQRRLSGADR